MTETNTPGVALPVIRLYVAGPMTGLPDNNYPAFNQAADKLRAHGYKVENPADNKASLQKILHHHPIEYTDYLRAGLTQLLHCDGVAVLEGWWNSGGARWEVQTAGMLGLEVRPVAGWLAMARDPESPESMAFPRCRIDGCTANAPHVHTPINHPEEWWAPPSEWLDDANRGIVLPSEGNSPAGVGQG